MKCWLLPLAILTALTGSAAEPYRIAVIPGGSTHEFWKAIHAGALKAESELNAAGVPVKIIWKGALREDDRDGEIQVVENFIARQVSAIVVVPLDRRAMVAPIEEAVASGIPVIAIDSTVNSNKVSSVIATDGRQGGRIAARRLGQLLGGRGNAILLRCQIGVASTEEREGGFLEVMVKEFPGIRLLSTDQYAGSTRETAKSVSENLLNRYGSQVNGIFAPNESSACGMLLALRDAGLAAGKVKFVGFDSGETLNEGLSSGDIQGLVVQNPFKIGYLGVKMAVAVLRGEKVPASIDTGVDLVTKENMNDPDKRALLHPPTSG